MIFDTPSSGELRAKTSLVIAIRRQSHLTSRRIVDDWSLNRNQS
jgi:hypothetical protein